MGVGRWRRTWLPCLLLAIWLTSGCRAFDESLLDAGAPDAAGGGCELARPPDRPTISDGADVDELIFAIKDVVLDQRDNRWRAIGYDLDGLCSDEPDPVVECLPPAVSGPPEIDGERGIDNTFGHNLVPILLAARSDFQTRATSGQNQGLGALLLIVRGWNGERDDPRVEGILSQTVFGSAEAVAEPIDEIDVSDGMLRINGELRPIPRWDGDDHFWVRSDGFLEGDISQPRLRDDNAYVADGTIVLRLPDRFPLVLGGDQTGVEFVLSDVVFTAELSADGRRIESAVLAGRWAIFDILAAIELAAICPGSSDYFTLMRLLDLAADIRGVPGTGGPRATCNAISLGLLFEVGAVATIDGLRDGFELPSPCLDGGVGDAGPVDAGMPDAGVPDGGLPDAG